MNFFQSPRFWVGLVLGGFALFVVYQFWRWEIERVEVPPGKFLVKISKWGKDLPEDVIVAPDDSYKGVMQDPLPPGRYFLNPVFWSYEIHDMTDVPRGKCLVLTRRHGEKIPQSRIDEGDILARDGERGIIADVRTQGYHAINPYAYDKQMVDMVKVGDDQVGVRVRKVGKDPRALPEGQRKASPYLVPEGYRGVQAAYARSGDYYLNPYVEAIVPVEVRSHKVEFHDIEFPSKDGFILKPHLQVEYAVIAEKAPEVLVRITDEGELNQADATPAEQAKNEILQKIILPHVRGHSRLDGSNFTAADFVSEGDEKAGNESAREKFRKAIEDSITKPCQKEGIQIRAVTLGHIELPNDLLDQIKARQNAIAEQKRNLEQAQKYKGEQDLKAKQSLTEQATEMVKAETKLIEAKTLAEQKIEQERIKLEADLKIAKTRKEAAEREAEGILAQGKSEVLIIKAQNSADVAPVRTAVKGFGGAQNYAQYAVLAKIAPSLSEIFASDDSDFAKLFSTFMTPQQGVRLSPPMPPGPGDPGPMGPPK